MKKKITGKKTVKKKVKKPIKKKNTALAKQSKKKIKPSGSAGLKLKTPDELIATALKSKAGIEHLKEVMKMKYDAEARESKKLFHINFCKMQTELPIIIKDKKVLNKAKDKVLYCHSSLEQMVKQVKPVMGDYGFAYNWSESFPESKKKRMQFNVTGYGHTESCYIDIPIMDATAFTNSIQQSGSASTYGRRYTMMNMLGLVCDEDNDGQSAARQSETPGPGIKNVTPPPAKKKKEETKEMLPEDITPNTLCAFGALKDAPVKYGKLKIDKLFALRRLAENPEAIEPVIMHVLDHHIEHYITILKYKPGDMKEASKMHAGKENWLDTNCDERYKLMQALRNIERKIGAQNEKS